jgi:VWFA-related protein
MTGLACLALALAVTLPAVAQEAGPTVTITSVDSSNFPTVTAYLTVNGANGLPLVGLAEGNFTLNEDTQAVAAESVVLNSDTSQELSLVLAVDVSTNEQSLAQTTAAAIAFVNSLGPNDQVALISYYDQVDDLVSFTTDRTALANALNALRAGGNGTVFNAAVDRGVDLLSNLSTGRKALILFTNSGDTTNDLSPEPILDDAARGQVRIYPMAYGPTINAEVMDNWARFSGGQAYLLPAASEIQASLLPLGVLMRQSYSITFESGLAADGRPHTLGVRLDFQGQTATAQTSFTGMPGEVVIEGPGLSNGQTVRGRVFLIADVTAPAEVETVSFWLDEQLLAELTTTPYRFDWDSTTAEPGTHTLRITALDVAGNQAETTVTVNVVLPPPIVITATPVPTAVVPTGPSEIEVFAQNTLRVAGQVLAGLALLVGLIIAAVLWSRSLRAQRSVQVKSCDVELINQGNSRSRYELRAEDPSGLLKFQFALHDANLVQRADGGAAVAPGAGRPVQTAATVPATAATAEAGGQRVNPKAAVDAGVAKGQRGLSVVENITAWMMNVAYLIPGVGGQRLRSQVSQARTVQYDVHEGLEMPGRVERVVKAATPVNPMEVHGVGPVNVAQQQAAHAAAAQGGAANGNGHGAPALAAPQRTVVSGQPTALASAGSGRPGWSVTPYLEPGQSLVVQLMVTPVKRPRSQHYAFRVLSRTAEAENAEPIVEHGTVALRGLGVFRQIWTLLLMVISLGLLALLVWYLLVVFEVVGG